MRKMMNTEEKEWLVFEFLEGNLNEEARNEFLIYLKTDSELSALLDQYKAAYIQPNDQDLMGFDGAAVYMDEVKVVPIHRNKRVWIAAASFILLCISFLMLYNVQKPLNQSTANIGGPLKKKSQNLDKPKLDSAAHGNELLRPSQVRIDSVKNYAQQRHFVPNADTLKLDPIWAEENSTAIGLNLESKKSVQLPNILNPMYPYFLNTGRVEVNLLKKKTLGTEMVSLLKFTKMPKILIRKENGQKPQLILDHSKYSIYASF